MITSHVLLLRCGFTAEHCDGGNIPGRPADTLAHALPAAGVKLEPMPEEVLALLLGGGATNTVCLDGCPTTIPEAWS